VQIGVQSATDMPG